MAKMIEVCRLGETGTKTEMVDFQEAERLIKEAQARGAFVVNKKGGEVIYELGPDVEEILIIGPVAGG